MDLKEKLFIFFTVSKNKNKKHLGKKLKQQDEDISP